MRRWAVVLLLGAALIPGQAGGARPCEPWRPGVRRATGFPDEVAAALERAVRAELEGHTFAGMSVGVSHRGRTWTAAYGLRDLRRRLPATVQTTYRFASITKSFTAIAILQLVEEGRLSLDARIGPLAPGWPKKKWPITVRQLLGHLGCVPHYANRADGRNTREVDTAEAIRLFADKALACEPGTEFVYTTWGYDLLGAAVETVSQSPYGRYLQEHVFDPAGMHAAALDDFDTRSFQHAKGYRWRGGRRVPSEYLDVSSRFAGGGTRGSVLDLLAFGRALLDHRLVTLETTRMMQQVMRTRDGRLTDYGMGFATYPQRGHYLVTHAGGQPETTALLVVLPAEDLVLAFAANLEGEIDLFRRISIRFLELLLEDGRVRREAWARDPADRGLYEALYRIFTYGVAYHRWGGPVELEGTPEAAFRKVRILLDRGLAATDPVAYRALIRAAHEPRQGSPFLHVGLRMARTVEAWAGPARMARYPEEGPLVFFRDYIEACRARGCSKEERLDGLEERVREWEAQWRAGSLPELERTRLGEAKDPGAAYARLLDRVRDRSFHPDYTEELRRLVARAEARKDVAAQRLWARRSVDLHPDSAEPLLDLADVLLRTGAQKEGLALYRQAHQVDPTSGAVTAEALLTRAGKLEERGNELAVVRVATALYPEDAAVWRARARLEWAEGNRDASRKAAAEASRLEAPGVVPAAAGG